MEEGKAEAQRNRERECEAVSTLMRSVASERGWVAYESGQVNAVGGQIAEREAIEPCTCLHVSSEVRSSPLTIPGQSRVRGERIVHRSLPNMMAGRTSMFLWSVETSF
jgi:hypothetical protein